MLNDLKNVINQPDGIGFLLVAMAAGFVIGILFMRFVPPHC